MNSERIKEILDEFAQKRIVVVGDVMLDRYIHGNVERLNPEAPVPVLHAREEVDLPGGASNVAKNITALGGDAVLVGVVGNDDYAEKIAEIAKAEGYDTNFVVDDTRPTITKVRYMVNSQQMLRVDWEETNDVETGVANKIKEVVEEEIKKGADAIVVSDYAKGAITEDVARYIMALSKEKRLPVIVDVKPSRVNYFKGADMITPNLKEAHEYLGYNHLEQQGRAAKDLGQELKQKFATDVYITQGEKGVHICTDGVCTDVAHTERPELVNPSGAGDVSVSTMCLAKLSGATPEEVAHIANTACAVFVQKLENVGTTREELESALLNGLGRA